MEPRPFAAREPGVRGVAEQRMPEGEGVAERVGQRPGDERPADEHFRAGCPVGDAERLEPGHREAPPRYRRVAA